MKKLFFIIAISLFIQNANAQWFSRERILNRENEDKKTLSWGYFLGFNSYDYNFDYISQNLGDDTDIQVNGQVGFNVGLLGNLRINKHLDLRLEPGLSFTTRSLTFSGFAEEKDYLREVKSTYIHIPLLLKVSTKRMNNFKPFIIGGISTSFNLASNEDHPEDNKTGQFRSIGNSFNYELGFGIDFYLFYFKFTPSIRGVFGMNNELVPDNDPNSPWTGNIEKMSSRGMFINLTVQ
ncbi:MAG: PorT family protein [Flavobacteriaceae bacterium]|nr:PorT family protein [Flavobacteriaceae bacterium]